MVTEVEELSFGIINDTVETASLLIGVEVIAVKVSVVMGFPSWSEGVARVVIASSIELVLVDCVWIGVSGIGVAVVVTIVVGVSKVLDTIGFAVVVVSVVEIIVEEV